ncbi:tannase-domain-containing protein [Acephala macrosclerotiorum]|nr:tannase-domain-containing protein [Acephala macrosclerotiorum]
MKPFTFLQLSLILGQAQALNYSLETRSSLSNASLQQSSIRFTTPIIAGSNFTGDAPETSYNTVQTALPSARRIWLPMKTAWNSIFLTVGNGGCAGGINYPDIVIGLKQGFATMSTDTRHNSTQNDATWTGNPEEMIDFGHRALHLSTTAAKEVIRIFYSLNSSYSYFTGCSTGGRQGWSEVQRYPADFDGVLVGASANWMTHLPAWDIRVALEQFPSSKPNYINSTIDPTKCNFHPEVLACGNSLSNSSACLNPAKIANLHRVQAPEASYTFLMNGATPQFGIDFFRHAVVNDTTWDYSTINRSTVALADAINPDGINAYDPDLRPFQSAGGKVIEYHGYQDQVIPSPSGRWYDAVYEYYGRLGQAADLRLEHCNGGDGAWVTGAASQSGILLAKNSTNYSLLYSLIDWVENTNSSSPETMIGTKQGNLNPPPTIPKPKSNTSHSSVRSTVKGAESSLHQGSIAENTRHKQHHHQGSTLTTFMRNRLSDTSQAKTVDMCREIAAALKYGLIYLVGVSSVEFELADGTIASNMEESDKTKCGKLWVKDFLRTDPSCSGPGPGNGAGGDGLPDQQRQAPRSTLQRRFTPIRTMVVWRPVGPTAPETWASDAKLATYEYLGYYGGDNKRPGIALLDAKKNITYFAGAMSSTVPRQESEP